MPELRVEPRIEPPAAPQAQSIEVQAMSKDVFIAPRPVEAPVRPAATPQPTPAPDALAAAAMENGARRPEKPARAQTLFERVTKAGRLLHREEPEPPARAAPAPIVTPPQPKLGPLDPGDRPGAKEEDMLDIPAFLRRQAN